jgi:hypothetical protein
MFLLALLPALCAPATAAPAYWYLQPTATELRPVQPDALMPRWHARMDTLMAGARASSVYRDTASRMDVALRLSEIDGRLPYASRDQQRRAAQLALVGAGRGWQLTLGDVVNESDALGRAQAVLRSAMSPGVSVRAREQGGGPRISSDQGPRNDAVASAEIKDPAAWRADRATRDAPRPGVRTGVTGAVVANLDSALGADDRGDSEGEPGAASLVARTFVQVEDLGLDRLRLQVSGRPHSALQAVAVGWSAVARQELTVNTALIGEIAGDTENVRDPEADLSPHLMRGALDLRVAPMPRWVVRSSLTRVTRSGLPIEYIAGASFRINTSWMLPVSARRYPRGQRPNTGGGPLLLADRSPIDVVSPIRAPATRVAEDLGTPAPQPTPNSVAQTLTATPAAR